MGNNCGTTWRGLPTSKNAKCLVQDALTALYAAESRKRNLETAARAALLDAASAAVAEVVAGEALRENETHTRKQHYSQTTAILRLCLLYQG